MFLSLHFRDFVTAAGPIAVAALWQGALVVLGLAALLRVAPHVGAADRFRAWAAAFWTVAALPLIPLALGPGAGSAAVAATPATAFLDLDSRWALGIAALWLAASAWRAADLAVHAIRLRRLWKRAIPVPQPTAGFELCATRELDRPCVIGFFRPRILVPTWLLDRLSPAELDQVVLHEAEHLRRRDDWTNLAHKLALVLFPLNPALAWMERELGRERELACDDAVVRSTGRPRAYAACLASLAERRLEHSRQALSLGAWRKRAELATRVHRLLRHTPGLNPTAARVLLALVACGLLAGSIELARVPHLVAFVAPPAVARSATPDLVNRAEPVLSGYRAVNAIAVMPAPSRRAAAMHAVARPHRQSAATALSASASHIPAAARAKVTAEQAVARTTATEFILFTTWEQVETTTPSGPAHSGPVAGDEAGDAVIPAAPVTVPSSGWTVTRLIFRVQPATATAKASGADLSNSMPQPVPPALIPFRGGWLVLQL